MSPVKKTVVEERLKKLREVISWLEEYSKVSQTYFLQEYTISSAAIHNLVLAIEIIVDIGNHILAEAFHIKTEDYAGVIESLGKAGVIPKKFAEENIDMAKFRNLLIHDYIKIDLKQVYQNLQKAPGVFRKFAKYFLKFLDKI